MNTTHDARLEALLAAGVLEPVDVELALVLSAMSAHGSANLRLAVALASRAPREGHTCLVLTDTARDHVVSDDGRVVVPDHLDWPTPQALRTALEESGLLAPADGIAPLVLREDRLYLQRLDVLEERLAGAVRARLAAPQADLTSEDIARLGALFPHDPSHGADRAQHDAAALALRSPLAIITGGPGTGKTTTVLRVLAALLARAPSDQLPEILLIAPTGKAASRLTESVRQGLARLPAEILDPSRRAAIPTQAETIHRALGIHPDRPHRPRHHVANRLSADIVVVDEVSMVDLPLMSRLFDAVRPEARLVLLGDSDQLASVDAGAVLRDLVESPRVAPALATLHRSRRFSDASALGALVVALRGEDWMAVERALTRAPDAIGAVDAPGAPDAADAPPVRVSSAGRGDYVPAEVLEAVRAHADRLAGAATAAEALDELGRFRLLTALRRGPLGADAINARLVEERGAALVPGTPILVTQNSPDERLANGDLGVCWDDGRGVRVALFDGPDGPRSLSVRRLPRWEPAFAMTVHKAQGSEFDRVMVLLPPPPSPILTRELVYTAVSRARAQVILVGPREAIASAHGARVRRATGLRERLGTPSAG